MIAPRRFRLHTVAFADFWQHEDGKRMLDELAFVPELHSAERYTPLLYQKDDLADGVIAECFAGKPFGDSLVLVMKYAAGTMPLSEAPQTIRTLLSEVNELPSWVDPEMLALGRKVCNRSGKSGLIVLRNYSLMIGYQSAAINKPLIATGALHSGAVKRIADTTNFWYAVTGPQALDIGKDGFQFCIRTRIVHAYSRVMIKEKLNWDLTDQGEPLNYWDMVATYLGFSLVFMRGLKNLGMTITDTESRAVYHMWKYIGFLIGIPPHLMPENERTAIEQLYLWSRTQPEADADSIALAQALHHEPLLAPWPPQKWQKKFIQHVNLAFNDYLIGGRSCAVLQLPKPKYPIFAKVVTMMNTIDDNFGGLCPAYRRWQISKGRADQLEIRNRVNMQ